jgi:hypothetical protein
MPDEIFFSTPNAAAVVLECVALVLEFRDFVGENFAFF